MRLATVEERIVLTSRRLKAQGFGAEVLALGLIVVLSVLVVPPMLGVVYSAFRKGPTLFEGTTTLENYRSILSDPNTYGTLADTFQFAVATACLVVAFAGILAWLVERTNAPFRRLVYLAIVVAFGVPVILQGMGWILLLGPRNGLLNVVLRTVLGSHAPTIPLYSMPAMVFVQSTVLIPTMFLLLAPALRAADPALEEAAQMSRAPRWQVLRRVTLPLLVPSLMAAVLLSFIIVVESFEIPALIGTPARIFVLSTEIYGRLRRPSPDYGAASAFSTLMMIIAMGGLYLYQGVTARAHRFTTVTGKGYRPHRLELGPWRWVAGVLTGGLSLILTMPVLILAWGAFMRVYRPPSIAALSGLTLENYKTIFASSWIVQSARNSFILGAASAVVVMVMTFAASWLVLRRRNPLTKGIDYLVTLPLVVPGVVLSLAVLRTYLVAPVPVYGTPLILLIAFVVHYLPYGMRFSHAGMIALHPELEEAAAVGGAPLAVRMRRIVAPLMWPALLAGGLFVFLASIRQLSLVLFLAGPGNDLITTTIFSLWTEGNITEVAAFAMPVVVGVILIAAGLNKVTGGIGVQVDHYR